MSKENSIAKQSITIFKNIYMREPISSSFELNTYKEPVAFNCLVKGKPMIAEVLADLDTLEHAFALRFSDGTEFEAVALESRGWWVNDARKLDYLNAVKAQLSDFLAVKDCEWDKFEVSYKNKPLLVWVAKRELDETAPFSIYYNGKYRFHLRKSGEGWQARCIRVINPEIIDDELASLITERLETAA